MRSSKRQSRRGPGVQSGSLSEGSRGREGPVPSNYRGGFPSTLEQRLALLPSQAWNPKPAAGAADIGVAAPDVEELGMAPLPPLRSDATTDAVRLPVPVPARPRSRRWPSPSRVHRRRINMRARR